MLVGHRWERDNAYRGYTCVSLPFGGVESHQWCVGCNCHIGDIELHDRNLPASDEIILDLLAHSKGHEPIEAGTLAEFRLKQRQPDI